MAALVEFDVAKARINCNVHPDKIHRQLSSSRLANGRLHAYHSVIAMSLLHPALLILTLFIVLRLRSMKIKLPLKFHQKRCRHSFYGAGVGGTTRPRLTLKTIVVMFKKYVMYLLVMLYAYRSVIAISQLHPALLILTLFIVLLIQLMLNFRIHLKRCHLSFRADVRSFKFNSHHKRCHCSYKTTSYRSQPTLKTTVVMLRYAEEGEMYLLAIIHQQLIISGDVELNPGPLGELDMRNLTNELVSVMAKWYHIGVQLGVDEAKLEEIENNYQTIDRRFSEVIKFWLRGNVSAAVSWKSLVEVLESPIVGEEGLAMRLRKKGGMIVSETVGVVPGAAESEVQPQEISRGQRGKKRSAEEKLDDSRDQHHEHQGGPEAKKATGSTGYVAADKVPEAPTHVVDKLRLTFPLLEQVVKLSEEEKEHLKQRLYSESVNMMHKFQELFSAIIKSLKERKVTMKELLNHIGCLVAIEPVYEDSKVGQLQYELPKAETIDDVMAIVREYSSFFNYQMIKNIINHFGGEEDRKNLATYLQEFAEYAKRKVYECPCEVGQISEAGRSNMFVTLDKSYDNCTVSSLKNFERKLAKLLNVSSDVVVTLCRILPGSLQLIFQIPLSIQKTIFPLSSEQEVALTELGVVQLSCGEYYFANDSEEMEDKDDHSSPEGDSDMEEQSTVAGIDLLSVVGGVDITGRGRGKKGGSSSADSAIGTSRHSVPTGATFTGISQFSEDTMLRDLRDKPYLRMEARLRPTPDDSSGLELHWAAKRGELDSVKQLIEDKELYPLQVDRYGNNALHYAAINGRLCVTKYLIEDQRLNPACRGWKSRTLLHTAALYRHLQLMKYLIGEQKMDPLCQDEDGYTPLHAACIGGDIDVVQYLISEMKKHTSLDSIVYDRTKAGDTAVHYAALNGHLPVVKLFIMDLNFDPNTLGFRDRPLLISAAQGGHLEVVRYLTEELQCDPSYAHGEDNATPLHAAAAHGRQNIIRYLTLIRRCSPLPRDSHGDTPLHEAAGRGQFEAVKFFISELKCDPNTPDEWGMIPLHHAARGGHLNIVQYLIDVINCNPESLDGRKITPLHLATMKGHLHIVKYLIEDKYCNPLCLDDRKLTPLLLASMNGHLHIVKYLIEDKHYNPL